MVAGTAVPVSVTPAALDRDVVAVTLTPDPFSSSSVAPRVSDLSAPCSCSLGAHEKRRCRPRHHE